MLFAKNTNDAACHDQHVHKRQHLVAPVSGEKRILHKKHERYGQQEHGDAAQPAYDRDPLHKDLHTPAVRPQIDGGQCQKQCEPFERAQVAPPVDQDRRAARDQIEYDEHCGSHADKEAAPRLGQNVAHQRVSVTDRHKLDSRALAARPVPELYRDRVTRFHTAHRHLMEHVHAFAMRPVLLEKRIRVPHPAAVIDHRVERPGTKTQILILLRREVKHLCDRHAVVLRVDL